MYPHLTTGLPSRANDACRRLLAALPDVPTTHLPPAGGEGRPLLAVVIRDVTPVNAPDDHTLALVELNLNGIWLRRCRLVRYVTGKLDVLPPQVRNWDPSTGRRYFATLADWPSSWRAALVEPVILWIKREVGATQ